MKVLKWEDITAGHNDFLCAFADEPRLQAGSALTIGGFDGPHVGHTSLFSAVTACQSFLHGVITFERSPRAVKEHHAFAGDVSTLAQCLQRFEQCGFDFVILIDFSSNFGKMNGRIFLDTLYSVCYMRYLVVGSNFRCGYRLDTGIAELVSYAAEKQFQLQIAPDFFINAQRVSSSLIRQAILRADFASAQQFLGYPYSIDCTGFTQNRVQSPESETHIELQPFSGFSQIMPPVGQYTVCIEAASFESCQEQKTRSFAGILNVTPVFLRCRLPFSSSSIKVQTIHFVVF